MDLKEIASRLESTRIQGIELIASNIYSNKEMNYIKKLANEVAKQKLDNSGFEFAEFSSGFPYLIKKEKGILVAVSPELIIPDTRKNPLRSYAGKLKSSINGYSGLIQFLPFQLNGKEVRKNLERELRQNIAFVNLPYDKKSIERRFLKYCRN